MFRREGLRLANLSTVAIEPHPHIRSALVELTAARKELQTAAHDFGGHRVEALRAVDAAIKQLRLAQQYDSK